MGPCATRQLYMQTAGHFWCLILLIHLCFIITAAVPRHKGVGDGATSSREPNFHDPVGSSQTFYVPDFQSEGFKTPVDRGLFASPSFHAIKSSRPRRGEPVFTGVTMLSELGESSCCLVSCKDYLVRKLTGSCWIAAVVVRCQIATV